MRYPERWDSMLETDDPTMPAPEICVEVTSSSNTGEEIEEKRALYPEASAEEVWVVGADNQIRFFSEEELERSRLAPECPTEV
jgi:Uma2 family endonuclease